MCQSLFLNKVAGLSLSTIALRGHISRCILLSQTLFFNSNFFFLISNFLFTSILYLLEFLGPISVIFIPNLPHFHVFYATPSFSMWGFTLGVLVKNLTH